MEVLVITAVALGGVLLLSALVAIFAVYRGWVFSILWGWFAVPLFGLPALSVPAAIGIALTISMLTANVQNDSKDEKKWVRFISLALAPLITLLMGWVAKQYL